MAVSSEQLLKFIEKASISSVKLDAEGDVRSVLEGPLTGEPLAKAIEHLTLLVMAENQRDFANQHAKCQASGQNHGGGFWPNGEPMAN